ncbi:MAG TPA: Nif3-like dinuclear metal center hexameric protein [Saprospiraceae bacterium]|nr:Nif3-like dinuclear metal center hexameric protein [Saprospiraceae bacterium]
MKISQITTHLEEIAPRHLQESYDNAGLIVGDAEAECTGCLISLDVTEAIIDEAMAKGCNLVVAHHPIIFGGIKQLVGANYVQRTVIKAIKNNVAIYAIHTNLDNVLHGVNAMIGEKLGLEDLTILRPKSPEQAEIGAGVVGYLAEAMEEKEFLGFLKREMETACIRHTAFLGQPIKKVALCGGSGSFLLKDAIQAGADVFITGDFKYHEFFDAEDKILIADIGHFESEQFTIPLIYRYLSEKFPTFALRFTETNTNPIKYFS